MGTSAGRCVRSLSLVAVGATAVASLLFPGAVRTAGPALLGLAAAAGLPHGAADVALVPGSGRRRVGLLVAYAAAGAGAAAVALAVPGPALVVLLALSVLHFAEGEAAVAPLLRPSGSTPGRGPRTDAAAWTAAAVALAVVAGPIARWPDDVARVVRPLSPGLASILGDGPVRLLLAVAVLAVSAVAVALARGDGAGRADVAVVVAAVAVVPPLALFAVWFACWHSARHLVRLAAQRPLRPLLLRAVAPSAAAAAVAVALTPLLGGAPAVLVVLLALTVPHAVVVGTALRPGPPRRAAAARSPSGRQVAEHVLPREHADRAPVRDDDGGVGLLQR